MICILIMVHPHYCLERECWEVTVSRTEIHEVGFFQPWSAAGYLVLAS